MLSWQSHIHCEHDTFNIVIGQTANIEQEQNGVNEVTRKEGVRWKIKEVFGYCHSVEAHSFHQTLTALQRLSNVYQN